MMDDSFDTYRGGLSDPVTSAVDVVPSDTEDLAKPCRALWIGTEGHLKVTMLDGSIITLRNVGGGVQPFRVRRVWATGTTAADIVACR